MFWVYSKCSLGCNLNILFSVLRVFSWVISKYSGCDLKVLWNLGVRMALMTKITLRTRMRF